MRQLDEFARLWNDTRARLPRSAWSWPLVAAVGGAVIVLVGTSPSDVGTASIATVAEVPIEASAACQEQTWPYLTDGCLQRNRPAGAQTPSHVRVLDYEPAMARAAIGATPWAAKATTRSPQARQKPATSRRPTTRTGPDRDRPLRPPGPQCGARAGLQRPG